MITWFSLRYRRFTQRFLGRLVDPFERALSRAFRSRQRFSAKEISPYHRVNGYPPTSDQFQRPAESGFRDFRLPVGGLVDAPAMVSLEDLRRLGIQSQITKHDCIEGWTAIAQWAGVPLSRVIELVRPRPEADTVVLYAFDDKGETDSTTPTPPGSEAPRMVRNAVRNGSAGSRELAAAVQACLARYRRELYGGRGPGIDERERL